MNHGSARAVAPGQAPISKAKRVLVFSDAVAERNGAGAYYCDLVSHLTDLGQAATLICPGAAGGRWDGRLRFPLPGDTTQRVVWPPAARIARYTRRLAPDVIVVATPGPYGLLGLTLARRYSVRQIVGFHTSFQRVTGLYWNRVFNALIGWYFGICDRFLFHSADVVIANSEDMANLARHLGARQVEVVGTPLPAEYLSPPPPLRRDGSLEVVFAGRLAAEKNVLAFVDAAAVCPEIHFRIAGHGPLSPTIARRADALPNLEHMGWLSRERLRSVLDTSHLLVLPSHVEAFGTVALEAMARGRNVLVSGNCGILEWPLLERALFRILPDEDVATALGRIMRLDPALRQEKANTARRAALDMHETALRAWLDLLQITGGD